MIRNLNKLTFAQYGAVLDDRQNNRGFPDGASWQQQTLHVASDHVPVYRAEGPVYLDFLEGMAILAVQEAEERMLCFYLDKPVVLQSGLRFAVVPFQWDCSVQLCFDRAAAPVQVSDFQQADDFRICHRLRVRNIYTMFYQEKEKGFFFKGEKHDLLELTYVDKGQLHSVVGGVDHLLRQGELMLYGPNQWHMQYADTDCATSFVTVTFDMEGDSLSGLTDRVFSIGAQDAQLLRQMMQEQARGDEYSGDMLLFLLGQLLICLIRSQGMQQKLMTPATINSENEVISKAQCYVAEHLSERLSVQLVAQAIGISTSHLTALFHKFMQIGPGEYIRRTKLEESRQLIREGKLNFTQIAQALSYSTVYHFSRQFKENFGITPSEYAKAIR